jgi:hypothetical protein
MKCIHGCEFPCQQCKANRRTNEAATGRKLTEDEFELLYCKSSGVLAGWVVAIYFGKGERTHRNGFIHRICASSGEFNNLSACTERAEDMKRWRTQAGARKAADAYQKNNPGSRCEPEPYHVGDRVEDAVC